MNIDEIINFEEKWQELLEGINLDRTLPDVDYFNHLIFDTYQLLREEHTADTISKKLLPLYRHIAQVSILLEYEYISDIPHSVQGALKESCWGLCYVIEHGFNSGYHEISMPTGLRSYTPAGCADSEADMSSFESYMKEFNSNIRYFKDLDEDYDPEDEE